MKRNALPFNNYKRPIKSKQSDSIIIKSLQKSKENHGIPHNFKKSHSEHIFPSNNLNKNPTLNKESSPDLELTSPDEKRLSFSQKMKKILKGKVFSIIIIIAILTLLFLEEIKVLVIDHKYDVLVDSIIFVFFLFVICEFILFNIFLKNYRFSFFFWLDLISILSLAPEIHLFSKHDELYNFEGNDHVFLKKIFKSSHFTKASRAAVAGSKAGRIFSYIKIFQKKDGKLANKNVKEEFYVKRDNFMGLKEKEDLEHVRRIQDQAPVEVKDEEENYSKSLLKSHKTTHYNKKKNIEEVMASERSGSSKEVILEMSETNKNKEIPILKIQTDNHLNTVYENKLENEKSSFFERSNFHFQKSNIIFVPAEKSEKNLNYNFNELSSYKNLDQSLMKKIEKFYGKNDGSYKFFKKEYEENQTHRKSMTSSQNKDLRFGDNQSDISYLNTSECDPEEVRGKQDIRILDYNDNNLEKLLPCITEGKEDTLIRIKSRNNKTKLSRSFSYIDNYSLKMNLQGDNRITNLSSSKGSMNNTNLDNALVKYMHETFEKNEKPEKLGSLKSTIIKSKTLKKTRTKEKFHPNLGLTLSKETTIKVIFIVLSIVFISPFVNINLYVIESNSYIYTAFILNEYLLDNKTLEFNNFVTTNIKNETNRMNNFPELLRLGFKDPTVCDKFKAYCADNNSAHSVFFSDNYTFDHLRSEDRIAYDDTYYIIIVYNNEKKHKLEAGFTIAKIIFIAFLLWIAAFIFLRDSDIYIVRRLEKNTRKVQLFFTNISNNFYESKEVGETKENEETKIIFKFIKDYSILMIKFFGLRTFSILKHDSTLLYHDTYFQKSLEKIDSSIMIVKIGNMNEIVDFYNEKAIKIKSKILEIIDLTVFEHFGELISSNHDEIIAIWDNSTYHNLVDHLPDNISRKSSDEYEDSLREEYESYECGSPRYSEHSIFSKDLFIERLNSNPKEVNDISNFIMICVLKILSRLNYNPYLSKKLKKIGLKHLDLQISLNRGNINHMVFSSSSKIYSKFIGKNLTKAQSINKYSEEYLLSVVMTEEFSRHLDDHFLAFTREILSFKEGTTTCNIFCFETFFQKEEMNENYYNSIDICKETSIFLRNEYIKKINENCFSCKDFLEKDAEVSFSMNQSYLYFLKNYRYAYYLVKLGNRDGKVKKMLKKALLYKRDDKRCTELIKRCKDT